MVDRVCEQLEHRGRRTWAEQECDAVLERSRRHLGSLLAPLFVSPRIARMNGPYGASSIDDSVPPGGASMNGMNRSGKPGIVQPMQMPPTFGQPPSPSIQPRLVTLQLTTGPQQPIFTWHFGEL